MTDEELTIQRRKKIAAARKRQRQAQQQLAPEVYEVVKLNNRLTTAIYDEKKRAQRRLMSKTEVLADNQLKRVMRRNQRLKKNIAFFGLDEGNNAVKLEVALLVSGAQSGDSRFFGGSVG